jgi:hypothetical protein
MLQRGPRQDVPLIGVAISTDGLDGRLSVTHANDASQSWIVNDPL